jgi:hypothetical protein
MHTALPYISDMYTVAETEVFIRAASEIWTDAERISFISWLAANPEAGDVIPGSGGCRKLRWSRAGMGKRGGARVIYYNQLERGEIWLLMVYVKAKFDNLPTSFLNHLREAIDHG